jgi:Leucine-rich repeat (LRR) protein
VSFVASLSHLHAHFFLQTLTTLNLSSNQISAAGAKHLAEAIGYTTVKLHFLVLLYHTHLLLCMQTLTKLDLSYNQIEDAGTRHLAVTLRINMVQ